MSINLINIGKEIPSTHFFIYKNKKYPFNDYFLKLASNYFKENEKELYTNKCIQLLNSKEEEIINIDDEIIKDFIRYINHENISLQDNNVILLNFLSIKYDIKELFDSTKDYITKNHKNLVLDILSFPKIKTITDASLYEKIIAENFIYYVNDDNILKIDIPTIYRILQIFKGNHKTTNDENEKIFDFLIRYFENYGKDASILFNEIEFDKLETKNIDLFMSKYSNQINFQLINSNIFKTIYDKEQQKFLQMKNEYDRQINEIKAANKKLIDEINSQKVEHDPNSITIDLEDLQKNIHHRITTNLDVIIYDFKKTIQSLINIPACEQFLLFENNHIIRNDNMRFRDYSISNNCNIKVIKTLKGDKPVIYLYPNKDDFDVNVKVEMKKEDGIITSIYPIIKEEDQNTWKVKANKDGTIIYKRRTHNCLFWECLFNKTFDFNEGFLIEGKNCHNFFEEKLKYIGFHDLEANEFIIYWCPKMEHSKYVLIKFQDEDFVKRAPLTIEPKPDEIKRIFMTFKLLQEPVTIPKQNLQKFKIQNRNGFFVLEWGGSQVYN